MQKYSMLLQNMHEYIARVYAHSHQTDIMLEHQINASFLFLNWQFHFCFPYFKIDLLHQKGEKLLLLSLKKLRLIYWPSQNIELIKFDSIKMSNNNINNSNNNNRLHYLASLHKYKKKLNAPTHWKIKLNLNVRIFFFHFLSICFQFSE